MEINKHLIVIAMLTLIAASCAGQAQERQAQQCRVYSPQGECLHYDSARVQSGVVVAAPNPYAVAGVVAAGTAVMASRADDDDRTDAPAVPISTQPADHEQCHAELNQCLRMPAKPLPGMAREDACQKCFESCVRKKNVGVSLGFGVRNPWPEYAMGMSCRYETWQFPLN